MHDYVSANLADGNASAGIFSDLARAFNTVNIDILIAKLSKYGIVGNALPLISSFLSSRQHCLKYRNIISEARDISCGSGIDSLAVIVSSLHK